MLKDDIIKLTFSMQSQKGAYAMLIASGMSMSAGIPTGWGIVCDLIRKIAELYDEDPGDEPWVWYKNRFEVEPGYSKLLDTLSRTPTERSVIVKKYFEPTEGERVEGKKLPTYSHKAVARLIKKDFIKIIITTNFDRLLEKALMDININPKVVSSAHDIKGLPSLFHLDSPLIIKVNGDYLDKRVRNTPDELANYEPEMTRLLSDVFSNFGLIICGWSGRYDTALIESMKSSPCHEYSTYWIDKSDLSESAFELLSSRDGVFIKTNSDDFFNSLTNKLKISDEYDESIDKHVPNNLPTGLSSFVGREQELDELEKLLKKRRLITVLGMGGAGKTRLSIELAKRFITCFESGIWFVDLSLISDRSGLKSTIMKMLRIDKVDSTSIALNIKRAFGTKKALLILDNCERVTDDIAVVSEEILDACNGIKIICTSRESLNGQQEIIWRIPELSIPQSSRVHRLDELLNYSAINLFVERAKQVSSTFELSKKNAKHVISICRNLDGLPLAIELASARIRILSPEKIEERLKKRFKLLTTGRRTAVDRQKTLRGAIDWSYDNLTDEEKRAFARFSVFLGGFTLESAVAVCTGNIDIELSDKKLQKEYLEDKESDIDKDDPFKDYDEFEIIDLIDSLVSKSLIVSKETDYGQVRYFLLQSIKEYASDKLIDFNDEALARVRHLEWFATWIDANIGKLRTGEQTLWNAMFTDDHDNIQSALAYSYGKKIILLHIRILACISIFWNINGYHKLAYDFTIRIAESIEYDYKSYVFVVGNCGVFAHWLHKYSKAIEVTEKALELTQKHDMVGMSISLRSNLSIYLKDVGKFEESTKLLKDTIQIAREENNRHSLAVAQLNLGETYQSICEFRLAISEYTSALEYFLGINDPRMISMTNRNIGSVYLEQLNTEKVEKCFNESIRIATSSNNHSELLETLNAKCYFLLRMARFQEVVDTCIKLENVATRQLADRGINKSMKIHAHLHLTKGEFEEALSLFKSTGLFDKKRELATYSVRQLMTMTKYHILKQDTMQIQTLIDILDSMEEHIYAYRQQVELETYRCYLHYQLGDMDKAFSRLKMVIKRSFGLNIMLEAIHCLELFSLVLVRLRQYKKASIVYGKVKSLREEYELLPMPAIAEIPMIIEKNTRELLGKGQETLMRKGAEMTTDEIIEFVVTG